MSFESKSAAFQMIYQQNDLSIPQDYITPISVFLMVIYRMRKDLYSSFDLTNKTGRAELLMWYIHSFEELPEFLLISLLQPAQGVTQDLPLPIPDFLIIIKDSRGDLREKFHLQTKKNRDDFLSWWLNHGVNEYPNPHLQYHEPMQKILHLKNPTYPPVSDELTIGKHDGFNIIGYSQGILGIGEDVRMAALAMQKNAISFSIHNTNLQIGAPKTTTEIDQFISHRLPYHHNLICLPATEMGQIIPTLDTNQFLHAYNIAAWQWELPYWPKEWCVFFSLIDEIWAFSHFAKKTFEAATTLPVTYVPMCVEYPIIPPASREYFKLPQDKFLFLIMFDCHSGFERKNPLASIQAFLNAFPNNPDVGLVVKTLNMDTASEHWQSILMLCNNDKRIFFKNGAISRIDTLKLINTCDAYISLHRAEGFGRIMAEAMLLEKPVIATNFSGNTDFTTSNTAFMVNGPLVSLKQGEYIAWENQYWCDPCIDEATAQLIACYNDVALREKLVKAGKKYIHTYHSAKVVGEFYKNALEKIIASQK